MNDNPKDNKELDENIDDLIEILDEYKSSKASRAKSSDVETSSEKEKVDDKTSFNSAVAAHFTEVIDTAAVNRELGTMTVHFAPVGDEKTEEAAVESIAKMPKRRKKQRAAGIFGLFSGIFKTIMYIIFVLGVAAYLSYNIIMIGNDVFAFVKPETEKTISITSSMSNSDVAKLLKKNGVINYEWVFEFYAKNKYEKNPYLTGDFTVQPSMNYDELIKTLKFVKVEREIVKVTIPEGFTTDQIIDLFVSQGIGTKEKFVDVINNYGFKHEFIKKLNTLPKSPNRRYRLEGYMFPDTYLFYKDDSEITVINKMLNNFVSKFDESFYKRCDDIGMNFDEIIILASMVEAEAKFPIDLELVSSVFHNRLKSTKVDFKKMQCDATVQYFLPERKEILPIIDTFIDHPYNTYVYEGLPPGAIGNPGIDSITAALWPDDPVTESGKSFKAYYFVSNLYGKIYYAGDSLSAHNANIAQAKKDNEEYKKLYGNN